MSVADDGNDDALHKALSAKDAFGEVFFVCVVGILPLVLFGFSTLEAATPLTESLASFAVPIANGQLFLYIFSLFGSLAWILLTQAKIYTRFWLGLYASAICAPSVIAVFIYGQDPALNNRLNGLTVFVSIFLYVFYIYIYHRLKTHIPRQIAGFTKATSENAADTAEKSAKYIG